MAKDFHRFERSGLHPAEFCAREGITVGSFKTWYRRSSHGANTRAPFIDLTPSVAERQRWEVELELSSGIIVRLRG